MTSNVGSESFTADEIQAFAQRVESWSQELSTREQALLYTLLAHAGGVQEVEGHSFPAMGPGTMQVAPGIIAVLGGSMRGGLSNNTIGGLAGDTFIHGI